MINSFHTKRIKKDFLMKVVFKVFVAILFVSGFASAEFGKQDLDEILKSGAMKADSLNIKKTIKFKRDYVGKSDEILKTY